MGIIGGILGFFTELLRAIPFFDKWFSKTPIEKETDAKKKVDKEHDSNASSKRPSNGFWKDRSP